MVPTTGVIALDCPALASTTQSIVLDTGTSRFAVTCAADIGPASVDILAVVAYSFQHCMLACASFNRNSKADTCKGVAFNADISGNVPFWYGTCWLKKSTASIAHNTGSTKDQQVIGVLV